MIDFAKLVPLAPRLIDAIGQTFIISHTESTELLEATLAQENLPFTVLRQKHQSEYRHYSRSYLCLLNHLRAWKLAAVEVRPTLVIEADFVPVKNFSQLPLPFNCDRDDTGISWLYTCAPQVYSVSEEGYAEGFSTSTVAYIITPKAAQCLLELAAKITDAPDGKTAYSSWDSTVDQFLRQKHLKNYIPFRNYGEHGGLPNPEHQKHGLSKTHRADVLYENLAFMPMYVTQEKSSVLKILAIRSKARSKGIARLLLGKFLRLKVVKNSSTPGRLIYFAIRRQLSPIL